VSNVIPDNISNNVTSHCISVFSVHMLIHHTKHKNIKKVFSLSEKIEIIKKKFKNQTKMILKMQIRGNKHFIMSKKNREKRGQENKKCTIGLQTLFVSFKRN